MYTSLTSLFTMLGLGDSQQVDRPTGDAPPPSYTRSEDDLRHQAASFIATLESRTSVDVTYHPYQPPIDLPGEDRIALPARIDISFRDPHGKTHVVEFTGHDRLSMHSHYFHESDVLEKWEQTAYLMRRHTLNEALVYLNDMDPRWQFSPRPLVPA